MSGRLRCLPCWMSLSCFLCVLVLIGWTRAEEPPTPGDLALEQGRLADRYERLEMVAARLAEISASTDPARARRLREAIARGRQQDVGSRFESIVELLESERLSAAAQNQDTLHSELSSLLELLLKDARQTEIESEQQRIRKYLREISRLIRWQKGIRARTEAGDDQQSLERDQGQLADNTAKLGGEVTPAGSSEEGTEQEEGATAEDERPGNQPKKPGDSQRPPSGKESGSSQPGDHQQEPQNGSPPNERNSPPPGSESGGDAGQPGGEKPPASEPTDRAGERLRAAAERMRQAKQRLERAEREGAVEEQQEALAELEQARAELERLLRQLREEEMERTLTQLAARFRKVLSAQIKINEDTLLLAEIPEAERGRREEIEAARLSHDQEKLVREVDKALLLLREEGTSVAFPETVGQIREDMVQVAERLAKLLVDELTRSIERDIVESLEQVIAALDQALKDLEDQKNEPPQGQASGSPPEPALVNKIAELKLIRSLQQRIYNRTVRCEELLESQQAEFTELFKILQDLAERQERLHRATRDLAVGRND